MLFLLAEKFAKTSEFWPIRISVGWVVILEILGIYKGVLKFLKVYQNLWAQSYPNPTPPPLSPPSILANKVSLCTVICSKYLQNGVII